MNLIIVESPTKAKTLSKFLGDAYRVEATMGHIKDLPKSKMGVDIEHDFVPQFDVAPKKSAQIKKIVSAASKADHIYLASDPDREGEAIAQHVYEVLIDAAKGKPKDMKRIVFHEITKEAVEEAISNPHSIDTNLVDAQAARRVLDRLVGYSLSPVLWKKVRRGLSGGRVQSVAVRLIVEREREIQAFKPVEYWIIGSELRSANDKTSFVSELSKIDGKKAVVSDTQAADAIVADLKASNYSVLDVTKREVKKHAYPPFTTSTMSQAGARLYGWSAKRTMALAQSLYEQGFITYHRTDSTNIASVAISKVREYVTKTYGPEYVPQTPNFYKKKAKSAQEAHEAIRPTDITAKGKNAADGMEGPQKKLYDLIWHRFVASQMSVAVFDETTILVEAKTSGSPTYLLRTSGQIMKFEGWRKMFPKGDDIVIVPAVTKGETLDLVKVNADQKFTLPPARFNEASIIKTLESLGIGRPSTYAPTISTIQARGYVEKDEGKFTPTAIGFAVNDFLVANFAKIVDYSFTAEMEGDLDNVAQGKAKWQKEIGKFWKPFETSVKAAEKVDRVKIETEKLGRMCPTCKEGELVIRTGRFGKFISCARFPECKHTEKFLVTIKMKCPTCKEGEVVIKKTKKGRKFFGCSRYPDCNYASWKNPTLAKKGEEADVDNTSDE